MAWFIIFNLACSSFLSFSSTPSPTSKITPEVRVAIQDIAHQYQLDSRLILAIAQTESNFNLKAVSKKGAKGLMQIMKETGDSLAMPHTFEIRSHLSAACQYLRELFNQFNSDLPLVLAAYNAGPNTVEKYKGIPPYPETQEYVKKVLSLYKQLKN